MALWWVAGQVVDDQEGHVPEGSIPVPTYHNKAQFGDAGFSWDPQNRFFRGDIPQTAPGYLPALLARHERRDQLKPYERADLEQWEAQARAIPTRDIASLTAGWSGETSDPAWWSQLNPGSPDVGPVMLAIRDKMQAGTATPQERALYGQVRGMAEDWDYRASAPQESDANPFGLGDNLFGALFTLGLGASGGLAAAPLAAGGASLATTLGSLGTLSGVGGTGLGVIGSAIEQPWLQQLGLGLGAAGGIAGGVGGLANLWGTGVNSLRDAARLAQSAGRITGGLGAASGVPGLQQAGRYLGQAGQLGQVGAGAADWLGWSGSQSPLAGNMAPGVPGLLSAAQQAQGEAFTPQDWSTQRGGPMDMDYSGWGFEDTRPLDSFLGWGGTETQQPWYDWGAQASADDPAMASFLGWGGDETQQGWYQGADLDTSGGGGGLWGTLGGLASGAGRLLFGGGGGGGGAGIGGPLLSALGSLGGGAIGSNAANEAARLQSQALNRGIDLQTAQWLQQQQNLAPYLQAGQGGLAQLQQLAGREQPSMASSYPTQVRREWYDYGVPSATPGWQPENYQGPQGPNVGDYRWTPGQGPQAQDYRYTPGTIPQAANYRYTPGQAPSAAQYRYTPGAVPTLSGQELLANDPGVQFRMDEGRRALEASAAARGGLLSGPTLAALQRQGQELSSQEYGQAWNRASQQAQLREQWGQAASQMGFGQSAEEARLREGWAQQASQMGFSQAEAESRLREQVNQVASQQGWSQAQAEAAFREQMGQLASQQGWNQALQGQQNQFTQGLQSQQWNVGQQQQYAQELYKNMMQNNQLMYGRDTAENQTNYDREQARYRQQLAQHLLPWEQASTLANLGGQATSMYGSQGNQATSGIANLLAQLGSAQGVGAYGSGLNWQRALTGAANQGPSLLAGLNA